MQLLTRVFDIMRAKNPEMVTGEKKKFVMKPPQVVRIGTKKTSFANFTDICKMYVDGVLFVLFYFMDVFFFCIQTVISRSMLST